MKASLRLRVPVVLFIFLGACQQMEPPPVELLPLPDLPDLVGSDPAVAEQLRERHAFVVKLQTDGRTRTEGLAWSFGQLGRAFHAYRHFTQARTCYTNAYRLEPEEFRWAYYLGHVERTEGNYETSNQHFLDVLALLPDHVPSLLWLADNELKLQNLEQAEERFRRAFELDPRNVKALDGLGRVALEASDYQAALQHLDRALEIQPAASPVHYSLGLAYRGLAEEDQALEFFERVPADDDARVPIDFEDPLMQEVSDLRRSSQYHIRRAMKAVARGQPQAALEEFGAAIAADPVRPDARYNLAALLLQLGQIDRARSELEELLERSADYVQARVLLARMLIAGGELEAAEQQLQLALKSDLDAERVHLVLGDLQRQQGRLDEAQSSYARAREFAPDLASARFGSAVVSILKGEFELTAVSLKEDLATLPGSRELELLLARLLAASPIAELRDGKHALKLANAAVRGTETVADAETQAMALAELGRYDEAARWQRAALARIESDAAAAKRVRSRLELYLSSSPCREPWVAKEQLTAERVTSPATP